MICKQIQSATHIALYIVHDEHCTIHITLLTMHFALCKNLNFKGQKKNKAQAMMLVVTNNLKDWGNMNWK